MKRSLLPGIAILLLCSCASPPPPYVHTLSEREIRVHALLAAAQVDHFVEHLERFALDIAREAPTSPSSPQRMLSQRMRDLFDADELNRDVTARVALEWDPAAMEDLEAFYQTGLGSSYSKALATPYEQRGRLGYAFAFGSTIDPSRHPERVALIERLGGSGSRLRLASDLHLVIYESFLEWRHRVAPDDMTEDEIDERMVAAQEQIDRAVAGRLLPLSLYSFRGLSNPELSSVLQRIESPSGAWLVETTQDALRGAVSERAQRLRTTGIAMAWQRWRGSPLHTPPSSVNSREVPRPR